MTVLGVMSDTHGNRPLMFRVADRMIRKHLVEIVLHLGDNYGDGLELAAAGYPVRVVPGLWCDEYADGRTPKVLVENYDGLTVAWAHTHEAILRGPARNAVLQCSGHTHEPRLELRGGKLSINPGHLKGRMDRGHRASYAVLDIGPEMVWASIHETNGDLREELTIDRTELG
jgi:predicted phosphodiesterase